MILKPADSINMYGSNYIDIRVLNTLLNLLENRVRVSGNGQSHELIV